MSPPKLASGGTLALVQNGDFIELDVHRRRLHLDVTDDEIVKRKTNWKSPEAIADRGCVKMYIDHVEQAEKGADLDFLVGGSWSKVDRNLH